MSELQKDIVELEKSVESAEQTIGELSSKRAVFVRGLIRGLGTAMGATILFAVVMSLLAGFVSTTDIEWIKNLLTELGLKNEIGR